MNWLLENPLPILIIGLVTAAISSFAWLQTGRRPFIYAVIASLVLMTIMVAVEKFVITDRETFRVVLDAIAKDIERNDLDAVLAHVHPSATEIREQAANEFPLYEFHNVAIKPNLKVSIDRSTTPFRAEVRFNAVVVLSDKSGLLRERRIPRYVIVTFEQDSTDWRVLNYQHFDPQVGFQQNDSLGVERPGN